MQKKEAANPTDNRHRLEQCLKFPLSFPLRFLSVYIAVCEGSFAVSHDILDLPEFTS
jgi:hypothetical protein